jgi:hypothetical protein
VLPPWKELCLLFWLALASAMMDLFCCSEINGDDEHAFALFLAKR